MGSGWQWQRQKRFVGTRGDIKGGHAARMQTRGSCTRPASAYTAIADVRVTSFTPPISARSISVAYPAHTALRSSCR